MHEGDNIGIITTFKKPTPERGRRGHGVALTARAQRWLRQQEAPQEPETAHGYPISLVPLGAVSAWDISSALLLEEKLGKAQVHDRASLKTPPCL